jgi:hypothetical protein
MVMKESKFITTQPIALRFVPLWQGSRQYLALIDTGAQTEVCGELVAKLLEGDLISGPSINLKGAFSGVEKVSTWKRCLMELGHRSIFIDFAVLPTMGPLIILGIRFLEANKAIIDLGNNLIKIHDCWIELLQTRHSQLAQQVDLLEIFVISVLNKKDWESLENILETATELSSGGRGLLRSLFLECSEIWQDDRLGDTKVVEHKIDLTTKRAVVQRPRRIPLDKQASIDQELDDMLAKGVIRPSESCFASEVVLVKKKDGCWRFCIDFRALNRVTIPDKHPLPRIQDLLRAVRGSRYFITLDLRAGYWQIPMAQESVFKTAFRTHRGLYEWVRMPFGLINAP